MLPATWLYLRAEHFPHGVHRRVVFSSPDLSRAQRALKSAAEGLFSVLFPSDCRICQSPLIRITNLPVCDSCLHQITRLDGVLCRCCGEKLFSQHLENEAVPLCGLCRRVEPEFRQAVAYGAYEGVLRDLIHIFKYQQVQSAGPLLGRLLTQAVERMQLPETLVVIPVPLSPGKRRARGFNQAEAIARAFLSTQPSGSIQLDTASLVRTRETTSQTGLTRHQRRANLRGAFAVSDRARVKGRSLLIVDDVMTTGTTAGECARVLRRAGAEQVFVATVARATKEVESVLARTASVHFGGTQGHA